MARSLYPTDASDTAYSPVPNLLNESLLSLVPNVEHDLNSFQVYHAYLCLIATNHVKGVEW